MRLYLSKEQRPIAIVTGLYMLFFTWLYLSRANYEFLIHIFILLFFAGIILYSNFKVRYPQLLLWALALWGFLHMSGGAFYFGETRLYEIMLANIYEPLNIFRYDQALHLYGFGVVTLIFHHIIKRPKITIPVGIVLVMAGTGAGALYEIFEFVATRLVSEHGVGGYVNNSMDLIFNFLGSFLAVLLIKFKRIK